MKGARERQQHRGGIREREKERDRERETEKEPERDRARETDKEVRESRLNRQKENHSEMCSSGILSASNSHLTCVGLVSVVGGCMICSTSPSLVAIVHNGGT